jgi:hypothetical protein
MKERVKVVFDRKGTAKKTGVGKVELQVYLSWTLRKWITVGTSTVEDWETDAQSRQIQSKIKHYEQIINAKTLLGEEMTIENFNQHIYSAQAPSKKEEKVLFNDTDLRQSFVEFCRDHMEHENLAKMES